MSFSARRHQVRRVVFILIAGFPLIAQPARASTPEFSSADRAVQTITAGTNGNLASETAGLKTFFGQSSGPAIAISHPYVSVLGRPDAGELWVLQASGAGASPISGVSPALHVIGGARFRIGADLLDVGDVNGDGRSDLLATAPRKGVAGYKTPGSAFVIYGRSNGGTIDLTSPAAGYGFEIKGISDTAYGTNTGNATGADFTGDGLSDIALVGGYWKKGGFNYSTAIYLIKGARSSGTVDLQKLSTARGLKLVSFPTPAIPTVVGAGDANGDGRPDLAVGAPHINLPGSKYPVSAGYVLFTATKLKTIALPTIGSNGYRISGYAGPGTWAPVITSLGDANGDGKGDIATITDSGGLGTSGGGRASVVFGSSSTSTVNASSPGSRGYVITSTAPGGGLSRMFDGLASAGDANGDGKSDLLIRELVSTPGASKPQSLLLVTGRTVGPTGIAPLDAGLLESPNARIVIPDIACAADNVTTGFAHSFGELPGASGKFLIASLGATECSDRVEVVSLR